MNVPNLNTNEFSEDQINKPNIKEVFHKLVMQHESYSNFRIEDNIRIGEGPMTEWRERFYYHNYQVKDALSTKSLMESIMVCMYNTSFSL